jgi:hypothetical protein
MELAATVLLWMVIGMIGIAGLILLTAIIVAFWEDRWV